MIKSNTSKVAITAVLVLVANVMVGTFFQDDAYISFRYADNLASHGHLYYNLYEQGPFGYTNPLYVAILALAKILSFGLLSFEFISRFIASFSLGVIIFAVLRSIPYYQRHTYASIVLAGISVFLLLFYPLMLPNFFSGLETPLFTLSLFLMLYSLLWPNPSVQRLFPVFLGIGLGLRMDAALTLFPLTALYVVRGGETEIRWSTYCCRECCRPDPWAVCSLWILGTAILYA